MATRPGQQLAAGVHTERKRRAVVVPRVYKNLTAERESGFNSRQLPLRDARHDAGKEGRGRAIPPPDDPGKTEAGWRPAWAHNPGGSRSIHWPPTQQSKPATGGLSERADSRGVRREYPGPCDAGPTASAEGRVTLRRLIRSPASPEAGVTPADSLQGRPARLGLSGAKCPGVLTQRAWSVGSSPTPAIAIRGAGWCASDANAAGCRGRGRLTRYAAVAQLAELENLSLRVAGSNPAGSAKPLYVTREFYKPGIPQSLTIPHRGQHH